MSVESEEALALLPKGRVFLGRYEIVRCLKAGGMGAIYEVIHLETRRRRALKVMLPSVVASPEMHARFRLEATVAADIESEHIVEVFDAGVDAESGAPFLVMELLRGEDLLAVLGKRKRLPAAEVIPILAQAASALDKTHAAGVVHRDLKPDNLFLARRDDGSPKLKILDFGIAKVVAESGQPAAKTRILGTPLYMSPEQIRGDGDIGPRADLYALGHIAFTLLVGDGYWSHESHKDQLYALMMRIVAGAPESARARADRYGAELPDELDAWFSRATALEPADRFATASELVESLARVFDVPFTRVSVPGPNPAGAARTVVVNELDPAATRSLSNPAQSLTPTTLGRAVNAPQTPDPSNAESAAPRTSGASDDRLPEGRRSIVPIAAVVVGLVAAAALGARILAPSTSEPTAEPSSSQPLGPGVATASLSAPAAPPAHSPGHPATVVTPAPSAEASAGPLAAQPPPPTPTGARTAVAPRKPPVPGPAPTATASAKSPPASTRTLD